MQRVFHEDGTVLGIPSHEPFWFQDSECRSAIALSEKSVCLLKQLRCSSVHPQQRSRKLGAGGALLSHERAKARRPICEGQSLAVTCSIQAEWLWLAHGGESLCCAAPWCSAGRRSCHAKQSPQKPSSSAHTLYVMHESLLNNS